jgi:di/tricarboxylate transporter
MAGEPTIGMLVVFGIIGGALTLFVTDRVPVDVTALCVIVALMVLEPWTQIAPEDGIAGFANPATITVLAMFALSEGVRRTGFVQWMGDKVVAASGGGFEKKFALLTGLSGSLAGLVNNTPIVAMMVPMITDIARKTNTSPSKLLMPVSFMAMMGGMLTLIGTSTNLLASDIAGRMIGRSFSMFEFTPLGFIVLVCGFLYLLFIGRHLIPERIKPEEELTEEFEMSGYLTEVAVRPGSPLEGCTVRDALRRLQLDADILYLVRDGERFTAPLARKEVRAHDRLMVRADRTTLRRLLDEETLEIVPATALTDGHVDATGGERRLVEVLIRPGTPLVGKTLAALHFEPRYEAAVLAIRHGREVIHERMDAVPLDGGDSLLVLASPATFEQLSSDPRFVVGEAEELPFMRPEKTPVALGILAAVVGLAAFEVLPILVSALGGVVAMIVTGCLRPNEVYEAVDWSVIFLLAGMIPLGTALQRTGGAEYLAEQIVAASEALPMLAVLFLFYLVTALVTEVVSNNASVVLMIPVAIDAAQLIGAEPFSFVLAVTFAASTSMLTPIGYQTNLMVYGPGGYRFTDFARVGGPLQLILAVVTTLGIYAFWGV